MKFSNIVATTKKKLIYQIVEGSSNTDVYNKVETFKKGKLLCLVKCIHGLGQYNFSIFLYASKFRYST